MNNKNKIYSKDEIKKAENIDIVDYCDVNDIPLIKDTERYYRHAEHDSLVIDRQKNKYYWNSKGKNGNVINFVQDVENYTFKGAVSKLLDDNYENTENVQFIHEPYSYNSEKETDKFSSARKYLTEERKIDAEIVDDLHNKGYLKQDKNNNVLFLWKDYERILGCSEQGTVKTDKYKRGSWKSIQKNSTEGYGFSFDYGEPKNLKFFESSIDAMSYASINKGKLADTRLISMEGLKHTVVINYMNRSVKELNDSPDSIKLCVDNDNAGKEFIDKFKYIKVNRKNGESYKIVGEFPEKKDWNEQRKYEVNEYSKRKKFQKSLELA